MKVKSMSSSVIALVFCAGLFTMTSCKNEKPAEAVQETVEEVTEAPAEEAVQINDAQIASIVVVANQIDVDYGKVALEKSQNPEVRQFAETMIKDHEAIINSAVELASKLGVTPEDNPTSQSLLDGQKAQNEKVKDLTGDEYDRAYIENEVGYHEAVIDAVKTVLIPNTQNEELKQALIDVSPLLDHHLQMAKDAQAKILN